LLLLSVCAISLWVSLVTTMTQFQPNNRAKIGHF